MIFIADTLPFTDAAKAKFITKGKVFRFDNAVNNPPRFVASDGDFYAMAHVDDLWVNTFGYACN